MLANDTYVHCHSRENILTAAVFGNVDKTIDRMTEAFKCNASAKH